MYLVNALMQRILSIFYIIFPDPAIVIITATIKAYGALDGAK